MSSFSNFKRLVVKLLPRKFVLRYRKRHFDFDKPIYKNMSFRQYMDMTLDGYLPDASSAVRASVCEDMLDAYFSSHIRPDEYFLYHFDRLSPKQRAEYMPQLAKDLLLSRYYGDSASRIIGFLQSKSDFFEAMKPFFLREAISVSSMEDLSALADFCSRHRRFIAKADKGRCGEGIKIISLSENDDLADVLRNLVSKGKWILEELIIQHPAISEFNPSSVNTVRFPSFRHGDKVVQAFPCFRFGRSGSVVDNAGQGGVFVSVDIDTGKICTDAYDEFGKKYPAHPDTGKVFKGFAIPQWQDLLDTARKAHLSLPEEQVYVAFDYALSDRGWAIVEANWGDWILQQATLERGMKKEFSAFLKG